MNGDSFKHSLSETPQVGEQLTSERNCLEFGTFWDIQAVTRKPVEAQLGVHETHEQSQFG